MFKPDLNLPSQAEPEPDVSGRVFFRFIEKIPESIQIFFGFPPFWTLAFQPETFQHRHFITDTFWHMDISAKTFHYQHILAHGHFVSVDVSVQGLFGTGTFWHVFFCVTQQNCYKESGLRFVLLRLFFTCNSITFYRPYRIWVG